MKPYIYCIILWTLLSSEKCNYKDPNCDQKSHYTITLSNLSNKNINFHFYWNYPDTSIPEYNATYSGKNAILAQGQNFERALGPRKCCCWESSFAKDRKEWIYVFDQDTISKLSWDTVRKSQRGLLERRLIDLN